MSVSHDRNFTPPTGVLVTSLLVMGGGATVLYLAKQDRLSNLFDKLRLTELCERWNASHLLEMGNVMRAAKITIFGATIGLAYSAGKGLEIKKEIEVPLTNPKPGPKPSPGKDDTTTTTTITTSPDSDHDDTTTTTTSPDSDETTPLQSDHDTSSSSSDSDLSSTTTTTNQPSDLPAHLHRLDLTGSINGSIVLPSKIDGEVGYYGRWISDTKAPWKQRVYRVASEEIRAGLEKSQKSDLMAMIGELRAKQDPTPLTKATIEVLEALHRPLDGDGRRQYKAFIFKLRAALEMTEFAEASKSKEAHTERDLLLDLCRIRYTEVNITRYLDNLVVSMIAHGA